MNKRDVRFLREYANFSLDGPLIIAKCLHSSLIKAYHKKDFDTFAHLKVKLLAEMVLCLETIGALLLSFSRWDQPGGILKTLLKYNPGKMRSFLIKLFESDNIFQILCFPKEEDIIKLCKDEDLVEEYYTHEKLSKMIKNTCEMYLSIIIGTVYNKVKHAGLVIRDPMAVGENYPNHPKTDVHIIADLDENYKGILFSIGVIRKDSLEKANQYLKNIEVLTERTKGLANFFAYCLEKDLIQPSDHSD